MSTESESMYITAAKIEPYAVCWVLKYIHSLVYISVSRNAQCPADGADQQQEGYRSPWRQTPSLSIWLAVGYMCLLLLARTAL